ncbi:mitochondrial fission ELM1 family protein [Thiobacillus sedimenti]|uniref:Mitochondrial fission ELM1 family protein n=1 Tax=Thiobacillus sedimenti TaxID=3110231 RepID=A0ABZ1CHC3_9PROT|nr:mitochondrial fission ELM1 family protein [Thiobacillus sp. SCUT-2]WRS38395.1 mitochondrial fission ELM1 family protein [Thiobacillus sp. SCUT-2]
MPETAGPVLSVWVISDAKPGHLNQSLGLAEALARAAPSTVHTLPALPAWRAWLALLLKRAPGGDLPSPDLIIGAGHATHLTLLAARRARGGRTVVLMKPSLPRRWFDLCILPAHDGIAADRRTLVTEGALNRVRPAAEHDPQCGLLLIGGPSPHFEWDADALHLQLRSILARTPETRWVLTTSRRTPADFAAGVPPAPNLAIVPHTETAPDWLPAQLARCGNVWVTPDSASMVFEALSAGAAVGVFDLPVKPRSRIGQAIARLADTRRVTRFARWCAHGALHPNLHPLAEADRCATWILEWLKNETRRS